MNKKKVSIVVGLLIAIIVATCGTTAYYIHQTQQLRQTIENQKTQIADLLVKEEATNDKLEFVLKKYHEAGDTINSLTQERDSLQKMINQMNAKVKYNPNNVKASSNATAYHLAKMLKGTKLHDLAPYFYKAEQKYGVNAIALASIFAHESGWGTKTSYENNLSGYGVYNTGGGTTFDSKEDNIMATAKLLSEKYLTKGASNYHGESLEAVNTDYCLLDNGKTDWKWSASINSIAQSLENKANRVG